MSPPIPGSIPNGCQDTRPSQEPFQVQPSAPSGREEVRARRLGALTRPEAVKELYDSWRKENRGEGVTRVARFGTVGGELERTVENRGIENRVVIKVTDFGGVNQAVETNKSNLH